MTCSRRDFTAMVLALPFVGRSVLAVPKVNSTIDGVRFGIETFSFHGLPRNDHDRIPTIIKYMREVGIGECEIMSAHVEPVGYSETGWWVEDRSLPGMHAARQRARHWRLTVPLNYYANIRHQFGDAGLSIYIYNLNFNDTFTDAERDCSFEAAQALGAQGINGSITLSEARRLVPFVEKHQMFMAMHNHCNLSDPDQFATPESFEKALAMSNRFMVTLDIGHFVAGNNDPVAFIKKHHDRIVNIHIRDRKRNNGPNMPCGKGDTPIKEVLRLIRDNHYPIPCYIEYEYGTLRTPLDEVKTCFQYCKDALA